MLSISVVLKRSYSLLLLLILISCQKVEKNVNKRISGFALGTTYSINYSDLSLSKKVLEKEVDSIINVINLSMSTYISDSDISKINKGDSLLKIDLHFEKVYNTASMVWKKTDGYFDPTVGALVNAYGFGPELNSSSVSKEIRNEILAYTGWDKTYLSSEKTPPSTKRGQCTWGPQTLCARSGSGPNLSMCSKGNVWWTYMGTMWGLRCCQVMVGEPDMMH